MLCENIFIHTADPTPFLYKSMRIFTQASGQMANAPILNRQRQTKGRLVLLRALQFFRLHPPRELFGGHESTEINALDFIAYVRAQKRFYHTVNR
jgi:hypothetical protein